jgi:hypothetical protein
MLQHDRDPGLVGGERSRLRELRRPDEQVERQPEPRQRAVALHPGRVAHHVLPRDVGPGRRGVEPRLLAHSSGERMAGVPREDVRQVGRPEIRVRDACDRPGLPALARLVRERAHPDGLGHRVGPVIHLGLHVHPALDPDAGGVGAVVGGPVVGAQGGERGVLEPRIPEAAEIPMVHVGVDHGRVSFLGGRRAPPDGQALRGAAIVHHKADERR